jgi:Holliday junction resolvase-like predicted endonuclease
MTRVQELCRKLKPVLGKKIDRLWQVYLAESDAGGKADVEQTLELLAAKYLGTDYEFDRSPFTPPPKEFASAGDIELGAISYADKHLYPFFFKSNRLKEHILVAGRSGSGKTNLTFMLIQGIMSRGIKVLALDWKRGYRDLMSLYPNLRVYTVGRDIAPLRFNPLIPPAGCEPHIWIKLIVDVIANAYLGGEGVISLLVAGLDHLYHEAGVFDRHQTHWPTIQDLLIWLKTVKLKGRAAMWQASAERILLGMTYGEFGAVLNTQDNCHVADLLNHNAVLEMDGLSSSSDKTMFSEALTLYLYRYRLAQGPQDKLTNVIVLEEAHNSIRVVRQYGLGYVFVDQSASLLSKVAFANSYATIAMSQKLRSDVQEISGAMNLTDEQKQALNTLPVGTAVVRLADEYPEPFVVKIRRCPIKEGCISDKAIKAKWGTNYTDTGSNSSILASSKAISPVLSPDKKDETNRNNQKNNENNTRPPSPIIAEECKSSVIVTNQPNNKLNREEIRFLFDIAAQPLSTTVSRYQRLHLSRRRGNAIRQSLAAVGIIEAVTIATRSGQVVLYQLTDTGRTVCSVCGIDPGPVPRESLEHRYWVSQTTRYFEKKGYEITLEHPVKGNGAIDLLAQRPGESVAIEVETGKSDINTNLTKIKNAGFDKIVLVATNATAIGKCQKALDAVEPGESSHIELFSWLDIS